MVCFFDELVNGQAAMHCSRHRRTASVVYVTTFALLALVQFVKNSTVSVKFSPFTSLCTRPEEQILSHCYLRLSVPASLNRQPTVKISWF